jgi:tetratricopeptide (TPR) repeat protein
MTRSATHVAARSITAEPARPGLRLTQLIWLCAATIAVPVPALAQQWDARATGEYARATTDTADIAERFAVLDAQTKTWTLVVDRLMMSSPVVKTLHLTRDQVSAYVAGLLEMSAPEKVTRGTTLRVDTIVHVNDEEMGARLDAAHHDLEAARDLLDTWRRIEQLQRALAGKPAPASAQSGGKPASDPRQQARIALQINVLLAQASATLIRREIGITSLPDLAPGALMKARGLVERALMLDDTNRDARTQMGSIFLLENDLDEAERVFREAVRQTPSSAVAHNRLGNVLYQQARLPDAEKEFAEAIRLAPSDPINHSDLGETLRYEDKVPQAIDEFQTAIRLAPHYMDPRHSLGIMLVMNQRAAEALVQFREAIRVRPSSARGHYNAALLLADLEEDEESAKEWREAVRLNPNNYNAHYNFAEMLRLTGELEESAKEFRVYVERAPDTPATQRNKQRARTYIKAFEEQ